MQKACKSSSNAGVNSHQRRSETLERLNTLKLTVTYGILNVKCFLMAKIYLFFIAIIYKRKIFTNVIDAPNNKINYCILLCIDENILIHQKCLSFAGLRSEN